MHRLTGVIGRLPWVWGLLVAALVVGGLSGPAAARYIAAPPAIHKASSPVDGHHFDLSAKHYRAVHHAARRVTPAPLLAVSEAALPRPGMLQRLSGPSRAPPLHAVARQLPPKTGPPRA